jgi:tetratricopeptide (TPR) repeat protein
VIKVECTACHNPYELDEKRLPASGLRMRCPKCGASFLVYADGRTAAAPAIKPTLMGVAAPGAPPPPPKKPLVPPPPPSSADADAEPGMKKVTGAFGPGGDDEGVKKVTGGLGVKKVTGAFGPGSATADLLDLPAPARPAAAKRSGAVFDDDLDLPAPPSAKRPAASDLDLPAPKAAPKPAPKPAAPAARFSLDDDLDLPSPVARGGVQKITGGVDLPAPVRPASPLARKPMPGSDDLDLPARARPVSEIDLPSPRAKAPPLELDLPAPRGKTPAAPVHLPDIDLPAPRAARAKVPSLDIELPSARAASARGQASAFESEGTPFDDLDGPGPMELDLPAPSARGGAMMELDLPAPRQGGGMDLDLPAPLSGPNARGKAPSLDLDLPAPLSGPNARGKAPSLDLDLPAPLSGPNARGKAPSLDLDLPAPLSGGAGRGRGLAFDLDLPAPRGDVLDLPAPAGHVDLPQPSFGGLDLPAPRGVADLPAARGGADLPTVRGALDLPAPRGASDLPAARGAADLPMALGGSELPTLGQRRTAERAAFDLPVPGTGPSLPPGALSSDSLPRGGGFGSHEAQPSGPQSFGELELPLPERRVAPATQRAHGEVDLPGGGDDGTEFSDIPVERQSLPPATGGLPLARPAAKAVAKPTAPAGPGKGRRNALVAVSVVIALGAVGAGLSLTPLGPFGYYALEPHLPGGGDPASVARVIDEADHAALLDTYSGSNEALSTLAHARHDAGLNRALLARSLVHESLHQLRWGDRSGGARAAAIRQRLEERGTDGPEVALALAADDLREGDAAGALRRIAAARSFAENDPFVDLVEAESALAGNDPATALQAFQQALAHDGGARAQWGIARALATGGGDDDTVRAAVDATLALAPDHGDALLWRARSASAAGDTAAALEDIAAVVGARPLGDPPAALVSPPHLRGEAWAVAGDIHERAGRLHQSLDAYNESIEADSTRIDALLGAGRVLLADRPADALTRFESVIEREDAAELMLASGRAAAQEARLGAARAMLDLDRDQEARSMLENLVEELPEDAELVRWLGRSQELLDEPAAAEQNFREAIRLAPAEFAGYLFLARLYQSLHRDVDAIAVLDSARGAVAETAEMREGLGTYELGLNRIEAAITEFRRALALDANMPAARFGLGCALRRHGEYDEALAAFDELARIDPGHPGMALERGQLFEARGESDRAVEYYTVALAESPDDPELLLRLGAAQVGAGDVDAAETTLARVQEMLPASAEAEHFVGRIAFARGSYPEAAQHFERAITLDASRGEFFVWAARAALQNRALGTARERADSAITRDPSLGDAYWVRGEVRLDQGLVRDALVDLERALTLRPTRYEALAAMGDCYGQLHQLPQAIAAYDRAVTAVDSNGEWWYRLGRLHMDADHPGEAARTLARATLIGEATDPRPAWLVDAHRVLGDASRLAGDRAGAIEHYSRYLELAPSGAIDRPHVRSAMLDLGAVPPRE